MAKMTLDEFKAKHADLIKRGMVRFTKELPKIDMFPNMDEKQKAFAMSVVSALYSDPDIIVIDRFTDDLQTILGEAKELKTARSDANKMGYVNTRTGVYTLM
jgi:hypothetical protein